MTTKELSKAFFELANDLIEDREEIENLSRRDLMLKIEHALEAPYDHDAKGTEEDNGVDTELLVLKYKPMLEKIRELEFVCSTNITEIVEEAFTKRELAAMCAIREIHKLKNTGLI